MRRFSFKKLFLIVFVLLFVLLGYSFFSAQNGSSEDANDASVPETSEAAPLSEPADSAPAAEPVSTALPSAAPSEPTPVPTEIPSVVVTDEFVIELGETEAVGGF